MKFVWDENKRRRVLDDHRVDFVKIIDIFEDPFMVEFVDEEHSTPDEIRFGAIGLTAAYGLTYLVYTEPGDDVLRFVTARRAENWMVKTYDQEEAEGKLEFLETSDEARAHGLRRIKRRHFIQPGETTVENCWAETTIALNPDVLEFFGSDSEKINAVLRREMEKSKLLEKLLEDADLVDRLREKLAA